MNRALVAFLLLFAFTARAHVGSPDVFYDGKVGPYPARVTIRMPGVVPGRAEISVRVGTTESVEVSFLPLYSATETKNAPPPDVGRLVSGETNLYAGELWLMSFGAYSVEVRIKGPLGEGLAQIPVTSVAHRQLPLPSILGKGLSLMGLLLFVGGIAVARAAARESTLPSRGAPGRSERRNGLIAAGVTGLVFVAALTGGRYWWTAEENAFQRHLREGSWPDLASEVRQIGGERILRLEVGAKEFRGNFSLIPDHGKLVHLFLVREKTHDAFAHLHPVRRGRNGFEVALPPLPEGKYVVFCDLTFEGGASSTASDVVELPPMSKTEGPPQSGLQADPDDSWTIQPKESIPVAAAASPVYRLPDGGQIMWRSTKPLRVNQDASLRFTVADANGEPVALEPYMGMLCHAAVLRQDGTVFAHLHPVGNFSMAAQSFFENKLAKEGREAAAAPGNHAHHGDAGASSVYLPYEFPEPGDYRIWVQFKIGERVVTGAFDAHVEG